LDPGIIPCCRSRLRLKRTLIVCWHYVERANGLLILELIVADANKQPSIAGKESHKDRDPGTASRAVKEYLANSMMRLRCGKRCGSKGSSRRAIWRRSGSARCAAPRSSPTHGYTRSDVLVVDHPIEFGRRPVGRIGGDPPGLDSTLPRML